MTVEEHKMWSSSLNCPAMGSVTKVRFPTGTRAFIFSATSRQFLGFTQPPIK